MIIFVPYTEANIETANSYLDIADADQIISEQSNSDVWIGLDDDSKKMLLIQSSIAVDGAMMYQGAKTIETQFLKFPRNGCYEIPLQIKFATAFTALLFSNDDIYKNIKREKIAKHETEYFGNSAKEIDPMVLAYLEPLRARTIRIKAHNE